MVGMGLALSVSSHGSRTGIQLENVPCIPDGPDEQHLKPVNGTFRGRVMQLVGNQQLNSIEYQFEFYFG